MTGIRMLVGFIQIAVMLALAGCGSGQRAADADLSAYRYAVVSFPNQISLGVRARADLKGMGIEVLDAKDARLHEPAVAAATLFVDLVVDQRPAGESVRARAEDQHGARLYERWASGTTRSQAVDAALAPLAPLLGTHELLEL